jgi:hypothetical protein
MTHLHASLSRLSRPVLDASVRTNPPGSTGRYDRHDRSRVGALVAGRERPAPTTDGQFGGDLQHG